VASGSERVDDGGAGAAGAADHEDLHEACFIANEAAGSAQRRSLAAWSKGTSCMVVIRRA
jgi:hypothetical protein